ncbi:MAG TPA: aconitate hydratase [Chthoniobacteraceae bacterium]|jgi:aconitate hydratase|nr:aconitate hydratase [Chthoniobacteraceae bacterium]
MPNDPFQTLQTFDAGAGRQGYYHSLPALEKQGIGPISRLPVSIRIVLESVLRNCDGKRVAEKDVRRLANWSAKSPANEEIPFVVARIVLQDFTGVPLLVDLAAMRSAVDRLGRDAKMIEPLVPVDLVVDHSVQVDFYGSQFALQLNMDLEFKRNRERYELLKWGQQAYKTFGVVPPGIGIVHQVNLEYLAKGVLSADIGGKKVYYPDTLVGTDSHTTMINGLGVVGWGVGGIEAEAGMLGQPVYFLTPEVVGVHLTGALREGVTATDLVLHITQMLRAKKVVGKFVEFYGPGAASLAVTDRATIGNMAPEYGATMGFFPIDDETVWYLRATGRTEEQVSAFENYFKAQGLYGMPDRGDIDYSVDLSLDLAEVHPSVSGPKRPQDRIELPLLKEAFLNLLHKPVPEGGYGKPDATTAEKFPVHLNGKTRQEELEIEEAVAAGEPLNKLEMISNRPTVDHLSEFPSNPFPEADIELAHGTVLIAAITSCTNTSNPSVMLGAGLLAKKAVERGLKVNPAVKTSLGPGSRVVSEYLDKTGLQPFLDKLGFQVVGYGCTTCIGNSGPLNRTIEDSINEHDLITAAVLSGNRNFEARIHQNIKANFLMSPPLVVAFALAGRVDIDMSREALGKDGNGTDVYLRDLWPSLDEVRTVMKSALSPELFRRLYRDFASQNPKWNEIPSKTGDVYEWDPESNYIAEPPFFTDFSMEPAPVQAIHDARPLGIFGDSVTTDHISPAGAIKASSPAGKYLISRGVQQEDYNSYGSRRGNDQVMTRGTFANVRIKNLMVPGVEGGVTKHYPDGGQMSIFDAAMKYKAEGVPLVVLAGLEYGTGSSRDWAAKGTSLLGVRAVVAASFERIHRSNLVGMGVLPLQFAEGTDARTLELEGSETFSFSGIDEITPGKTVQMTIKRAGGKTETVPLRLRIDTSIEVDYYKHGGILPYVLRQILAAAK